MGMVSLDDTLFVFFVLNLNLRTLPVGVRFGCPRERDDGNTKEFEVCEPELDEMEAAEEDVGLGNSVCGTRADGSER